MKKLIVALTMFLAVSMAHAGDWKPSDNGVYIYTQPLKGGYLEGVALLYTEDYAPVLRHMFDLERSVSNDYVWRIETLTMWIDNNDPYTVTDVKYTKTAATIDRLVSTDFTVNHEFIDELKAGSVLRVKLTAYDGDSYTTAAFGLDGFTRMNSKLLNGDFE